MAEPVWMLDTNAPFDLIRDPRGARVRRLSNTEPDAVCTSTVVACELRYGAQRKGSDALTQRVVQLLASLTVLPLSEPADQHYADICVALERAGTPIGNRDLFIAAHARSRGQRQDDFDGRANLRLVAGLGLRPSGSGRRRARSRSR